MSKRRISQKVLTDLGEERIMKLLSLTEKALREGKPERAARYVELSRRISAKTQVPMPREFSICNRCGMLLMPGLNSRVRLNNHMVCITCGTCGEIRRKPYLREQSHD